MTAMTVVDICEGAAGTLDGWLGGAAGVLLRGGRIGLFVAGVIEQGYVPAGQVPSQSKSWHTLFFVSMHW
jgi:hypothetical protein